jgi:hypothetical protein
METIIILLTVALLLTAIATLGVDSRDGNDWINHPRP